MVLTRARAIVIAVLAIVLILGTATTGFSQTDTAQLQGGTHHVHWASPTDPLHEWALGYDTRDIDMMRNAFTDDARFVFHLSTGGDPLVFEGIDEVMELFTSSLEAQEDVRRHVTTNHVIEPITRWKARVTSYLTLLVIADPTQPPVLQSTGIYTDTVVVRHDGWRIQERVLRLDTPS